ncbi:DUF547 domain-containing protein [Parasalinivibrio latis]|uniref:DUF547 domain-containing protein n=1 Tax=Parasalinivibrio latis TaxID=2952610 RepID=UPI0030DF20E9
MTVLLKKLFSALLTFVLITGSAFAAPKSELWPYWDKTDPDSTQTISHKPWQRLLDTYLVEKGEYTLFDYQAIGPEDRNNLKSYITGLADLDPRGYTKAEQYAYWVNLYNAITVELILDNYPVKSITKLGGLFSFGPWGDKVITITGQDLTLNDIEHRILRPIWDDPRTHYAVNCASLGCPNLQPTAFTASNSENLLEKAAIQFVNSDKGVNQDGDKLQLSSIYEWFADDFGGSEKGVLEHLNRYRQSNDLKDFNGKIQYEYDWSLNKT